MKRLLGTRQPELARHHGRGCAVSTVGNSEPRKGAAEPAASLGRTGLSFEAAFRQNLPACSRIVRGTGSSSASARTNNTDFGKVAVWCVTTFVVDFVFGFEAQ